MKSFQFKMTGQPWDVSACRRYREWACERGDHGVTQRMRDVACGLTDDAARSRREAFTPEHFGADRL